ncbi:hypothetical protein D3C72_2098590 [compost metagenome]
MAAKLASGMLLSSSANSNALSSNSTPCSKIDTRLRAPACTLAELRTITAVIGKPPSSPLMQLPTPCARSSLSAEGSGIIGAIFFKASWLSRVSRLATIARVIATR